MYWTLYVGLNKIIHKRYKKINNLLPGSSSLSLDSESLDDDIRLEFDGRKPYFFITSPRP